jgi:hypothetical protein
MSDDRVIVRQKRLTVACPECDAGDVRTRGAAASPGATLLCQACKATFDEAIVRATAPSGGRTAKYADVSLEDVDL